MKHHYALINEDDPQKFVSLVEAAMIDGWVPLGGVSTVRTPGKNETAKEPKILFSQAMLRRGVNGVDIKT